MMDEMKEKIARAITGPTQYDDLKRMGKHASCLLSAQAALTAIEAAGYVVVPKEPTEAMVDAGLSEDGGGHDDPCNRSIQASAYKAMIEAAKAQPVGSRQIEPHLVGGGINLDHYATLADSAASFDPEKQFEKDREEGK
jgi:hypothetical protein